MPWVSKGSKTVDFQWMEQCQQATPPPKKKTLIEETSSSVHNLTSGLQTSDHSQDQVDE